jgi:predicted nucleic acid binding AN1-type Zn finger protein
MTSYCLHALIHLQQICLFLQDPKSLIEHKLKPCARAPMQWLIISSSTVNSFSRARRQQAEKSSSLNQQNGISHLGHIRLVANVHKQAEQAYLTYELNKHQFYFVC